MCRSCGAATSVTARAGALLAALALLVACSGGDPETSTGDRADRSSTPGTTRTAEEKPVLPPQTERLDSVAALGHSGLTGTLTDPDDPYGDAVENSWATGDNPRVDSIYLRLLADHPALEGHHYNAAVNGATIDGLVGQYESLLDEAGIAPDLFVIQFIDNDIRCDGSDAEHAKEFGRQLDRGLSRIATDLPEAQFYLTGPWASVPRWAAWAAHHEQHVQANSGTGPCDVFDGRGRPLPAGIRSMQRIIDSYTAEQAAVCARHPGCFTDRGALERFAPVDRDVAWDLNHLSVAGHAKYARIAWSALPDEIKRRR